VWLKRLGAAAAAVVLIAGALVTRDALDDDDDPTIASESSVPRAPAPDAIVCAEELGGVCASLRAALGSEAVRIEPAYTTLDALAGEGAGDALWVTMSPFPAMVDAQRATTGDDPLALATTPVAATPLAVASPASGDRLGALEAVCAGAPLWRCIGEQAGTPWADLGADVEGTVRPSVGDVERSGLALVSFSGAVAGYFGEPTYRQASWETDPAFLPWLQSVATTVPTSVLSGGTPLATMASRRSALDIAATTDAELAPLSADPSRFEVKYPEPTMGVEGVVAGPVPGADLLREIGTAFTANGWGPPAATPPAAPSAVTMLGLRQLWRDAT
jgi:hypothetical protein